MSIQQKQLIDQSPSEKRWNKAIKRLEIENHNLRKEIRSKDLSIRKKNSQIENLKNELNKKGLSFREKLFGKKQKKLVKPHFRPLTGKADQVKRLMESGYSDGMIALHFGTSKRNVARFIKRHSLR